MHDSLKKITILLSFSIISVSSLAVDEDYYSVDIDNAIKSAKQNPISEQHVGARWYNRSTSRSFDFPKMMNSEMEKEVIEGAVGITTAEKKPVVVIPQETIDLAYDRVNRSNTLDDATGDHRRNIRAGEHVINKIDIPYEIYIKTLSADGILGHSLVREVRGRPEVSWGCNGGDLGCRPPGYNPNDKSSETRIH